MEERGGFRMDLLSVANLRHDQQTGRGTFGWMFCYLAPIPCANGGPCVRARAVEVAGRCTGSERPSGKYHLFTSAGPSGDQSSASVRQCFAPAPNTPALPTKGLRSRKMTSTQGHQAQAYAVVLSINNISKHKTTLTISQ